MFIVTRVAVTISDIKDFFNKYFKNVYAITPRRPINIVDQIIDDVNS